MRRLPEAWIAPPATRELRELVRHRAKLVHLRTSLRCQIHAVLANHGIRVPVSDLFGVEGIKQLEHAELPPAARSRVDSLLRLIGAFNAEIDATAKTTATRLGDHPGYAAVQTSPASARSSGRSSSPRSATSPASRHPPSWPAGPG